MVPTWGDRAGRPVAGSLDVLKLACAVVAVRVCEVGAAPPGKVLDLILRQLDLLTRLVVTAGGQYRMEPSMRPECGNTGHRSCLGTGERLPGRVDVASRIHSPFDENPETIGVRQLHDLRFPDPARPVMPLRADDLAARVDRDRAREAPAHLHELYVAALAVVERHDQRVVG